MAKRKAKSPRKPAAITPVEYGGLLAAYDHFNRELFEGGLVDVFITYQRHAHSRGYFSPDRYSGREIAFGKHELALNPDAFVDRTDEQICSTLVHEQVHVWQHVLGKPSSRGYHDREWATKMEALGLQPSSTGAVGGRRTGQRMSHYIIPGGPFTHAFAKLAAAGWKLNLQSAAKPGEERKKKNKTTFVCPNCGQRASGKPSLAITCTPCAIPMPAAEAALNPQAAAA